MHYNYRSAIMNFSYDAVYGPFNKGVFFFFLIRDLLPKTKNPTNLFTIVNPPKSMTTKEHSCLKLLEKMLMHPLNFGVVALIPFKLSFQPIWYLNYIHLPNYNFYLFTV